MYNKNENFNLLVQNALVRGELFFFAFINCDPHIVKFPSSQIRKCFLLVCKVVMHPVWKGKINLLVLMQW